MAPRESWNDCDNSVREAPAAVDTGAQCTKGDMSAWRAMGASSHGGGVPNEFGDLELVGGGLYSPNDLLAQGLPAPPIVPGAVVRAGTMPALYIGYPECAPIDLSPADRAIQRSTQDLTDRLWPSVEKVVSGLNDWQQGHHNESDRWHDVDLQACDRAYQAFPELAKHEIPQSMIGAIILNEVEHRDGRDFVEDMLAQLHVAGGETSIGPAQMQIQNIRDLATKYPLLKQWGDPVKAALEPDKAPYFVAAYLTDRLQSMERYNKEHPNLPMRIGAASLAYSYNPDLLQRDGRGPAPDSYRSKTAGEMVAERISRYLTGQPVESLQGWHRVPRITNEWQSDASQEVAGIFDKMKKVEEVQSRH